MPHMPLPTKPGKIVALKLCTLTEGFIFQSSRIVILVQREILEGRITADGVAWVKTQRRTPWEEADPDDVVEVACAFKRMSITKVKGPGVG